MMRKFFKNFKMYFYLLSIVSIGVVMFTALGVVIPAMAFHVFGPALGLVVGILCYAFIFAIIKTWEES